jgi:hypothetical protein
MKVMSPEHSKSNRATGSVLQNVAVIIALLVSAGTIAYAACTDDAEINVVYNNSSVTLSCDSSNTSCSYTDYGEDVACKSFTSIPRVKCVNDGTNTVSVSITSESGYCSGGVCTYTNLVAITPGTNMPLKTMEYCLYSEQ